MSGTSFDQSPRAILPPATIGILGGGQLGRMLALAARAMGYRVWAQDPDPECPAASVVDRLIVGAYDDTTAARELASGSEVVTYELEHVAADVVRVIADARPVRPGLRPLTVTQDRLAERRFVGGEGVRIAPWREVATPSQVLETTELGELEMPLRLKVPIGGYDGRSQLRIQRPADLDDAWARLGQPPGTPLLAERELRFDAELSVVVARGVDGQVVPYPVARNVHDQGILVESVAPAQIPDEVARQAVRIASHLATAMDLIGTLTAELFLLGDGELVVNELAPRVHNSGHWTIEGAATSQFEQHVRAICGLTLGSPAATGVAAMVNVLGAGSLRPAQPTGISMALSDPGAHLHLYDKRRVFERRKMGHVTVVSDSVADSLERARKAAAAIGWATGAEGVNVAEAVAIGSGGERR